MKMRFVLAAALAMCIASPAVYVDTADAGRKGGASSKGFKGGGFKKFNGPRFKFKGAGRKFGGFKNRGFKKFGGFQKNRKFGFKGGSRKRFGSFGKKGWKGPGNFGKKHAWGHKSGKPMWRKKHGGGWKYAGMHRGHGKHGWKGKGRHAYWMRDGKGKFRYAGRHGNRGMKHGWWKGKGDGRRGNGGFQFSQGQSQSQTFNFAGNGGGGSNFDWTGAVGLVANFAQQGYEPSGQTIVYADSQCGNCDSGPEYAEYEPEIDYGRLVRAVCVTGRGDWIPADNEFGGECVKGLK